MATGEFKLVGSTGAQITGYTGPGGDVVIPDRIGGAPVTEIGNFAFSGKISLTSVTIPDSVNVIGSNAFDGCTGLQSGVFPANVASIGSYAYYRCTSLTSVRIPNSVTNFESGIFILCTSLTNAVIPRTVTNNLESAFGGCASLTQTEVDENNPAYASAEGVLFDKAQSELIAYPRGKTVLYYLPGTTGWDSTVAGRPTALWRPQMRTGDFTFGVRSNQFGFSVTWASGRTVVVEAATNLAESQWSPVLTNTLSSGSYYFSDPERTNHPGRFYHIMSQ